MKLKWMAIATLAIASAAIAQSPYETAPSNADKVPNMIGYKALHALDIADTLPPFKSGGIKVDSPQSAEGAEFVHEQIYWDQAKKIVSRLEVYQFGENHEACLAFDEKTWGQVSSPKSLTFKATSDGELQGPGSVVLKRKSDCASSRAYVSYLLHLPGVDIAQEDWEIRTSTL
ncbi:MAG: hypothetical protein CBC55_04600 [Gammaproteobacteria bacterium TMED95]|nr:MAG: hypothetical protein CBC55_04600 [Gammaproteobacteria bacterium TMED95]|tara:strand:+ start:3451 stop:3969 length:519 start_codon:yes stop_codon:yes gene_type:complete